MTTSPPEKVMLQNGAKDAPLAYGVFIVLGGGAVWLGLRLDGWGAVCLFVVAGVALALLIYITQSLLRLGPSRLVLTSQGLVHKVGGKLNVVPAEAIEAVGLVRHGKERPAELVLWYDGARMPEVPKDIRRLETSPGRVVLVEVMDGPRCFPPHRVKEVREFVQAHKLGEWRNRSAAG